jgi:CRISPR system Cascade subunit CasC
MLADMPEKNQNAACQVAHAISTHSVEREFDFYTAVDDCKPEDTAGADMMGTVEFNSACFYRYAVVDFDKLVANLQNDETLAIKGVNAFLEGFVLAEPKGKQNTFAAHNPPEFVVITVRRNAAPRNFANAFETAIRVKKDESLTRKSAEGLASKAKSLHAAYGGSENAFVLNLIGANVDGFGTVVPSLQDLLDNTLSAIQG